MKFIRLAVLFSSYLCLVGCPGVVPGSRPYLPRSDSYEATLFPQAKRNIFPQDVRKDLDANREKILLWTGIVKSSEFSEEMIITKYEHHYWDWIEDYSTQRQIAFLSPRGEGSFQCEQDRASFGKIDQSELPKQGVMAIVYGRPKKISSDGTVELNCAPFLKNLGTEKFSTDIWDYGRDFLLKGDKADFKVLRIPVWR